MHSDPLHYGLRFEVSYLNNPTSQDEPQGITQGIHAHVDLSAKPAAAPAQGLGCLATFLGGAPAAQGWARTTVLSMMRHSRSGSAAKC